MPETNCCYFAKGEGCRFCSLATLQNKARFSAQLVADAALCALEHNSKYELALSGGTPDAPDKGANYFAEIAALVAKKKRMAISAELVPPDDNFYLDRLHDAGVTSVIMNIELWDGRLRQMFCPGKARVPIERYLQAIEYAAKVFGPGQVASVLIAGLQGAEVLLEGAQAVIELGCIPTVIPFKPFDACAMAAFPKTNPEDILRIHREVSDILIQKGLNPTLQKGCTGCGGCSLETVAFKLHIPTQHASHSD
jgi:biotin synthase-related radical SAM superfamily protein